MQLSIILIILLQVCFSCALHSYSGYMCLLLCSSVVLVQSLWFSSSTRLYSTVGTVMFWLFRMLLFFWCCLHTWYILCMSNNGPLPCICITSITSCMHPHLWPAFHRCQPLPWITKGLLHNQKRAGITMTSTIFNLFCSPLAYAFSSPAPWTECSVLLTEMSSKSPGFRK